MAVFMELVASFTINLIASEWAPIQANAIFADMSHDI